MSEIKRKDEKDFSSLAKELYKQNVKETEEEANRQYEEMQKSARKVALDFQEAKHRASDSTGKVVKHINDDKFYLVNFSDLHSPEGNMAAFMENLTRFAAIPNAFFVFGGDQINNSIKGSVGDTHGEILTPRQQVALLADIIKEVAKTYPNLIDRIWAIVSGNHENRTYKEVSEDPAFWLAQELGIEEKYFKNVAIIEANVVKKLDEKSYNEKTKKLTKRQIEEKLKTLTKEDEIKKFVKEHSLKTVKTNILVTHAEAISSGAQADHALSSKIDSSIDLVTYGHTHSIETATETKHQINTSRGSKYEKKVTFVNFGSYSNSTEYAERALYPLQKQSGSQIVRVSNIGGNTNIIDVLDAKNLIPDYAQDKINKVLNEFEELSQIAFETKPQLDRAYTEAIKKIYKEYTIAFKEDKKIKEEFFNRNTVPTDIYFAPLSGIHVGKDNNKPTIKQLKSIVDTLSKIDSGVAITLTDLVFYKKAFTLTNKNGNLLGEKFPEESFSYILQAAELLKPVKDKISAYFNGEQEEKIMKYHSEALAKMAVNRLQMDDSLCFEPYDEEKIHMEKIKIQAQQVEGYNKNVLSKEVERAYKDIRKTFAESLPFMAKNYAEMTEEERDQAIEKVSQKYLSLPDGVETTSSGKAKYNVEKNARLDFLKKVLAYKLRADKKLLSLSEDKTLIDHKFPLEDIELRTPHKDLIQNIFAHVLGIEPNKILTNPTPNQTKTFVKQVQDESGKTRRVVFCGSSSKSKAGRRSIRNNIQNTAKAMSGAHIYYTNTRSGKEFITLNLQKDGDKVRDNVFISAGGLTSNEEGLTTANKIYRISARSPKNVKIKSRGIYANMEKDFDILCESLNYETVMLKDDVFSEAVKTISKSSYEQAHEALKEREKRKEKIVYSTFIEQVFDDIDKEVFKKEVKPQNKNTKKKPSERSNGREGA